MGGKRSPVSKGKEGCANSCGGLAPQLRWSEYGSIRSTTDAIPLPEPKPRAMSLCLIVPSIRSRDVAGAQRPDVGYGEHLFQLLDFGNGSFKIHALTV